MKTKIIKNTARHSIVKISALTLFAFSSAGCIEPVPETQGVVELPWNELFTLKEGNHPTLYAKKSFAVGEADCLILPAHYSLGKGKMLNRDFIASDANASLRWAFDDNPGKGWAFTVRYSEAQNRYDILSCQ